MDTKTHQKYSVVKFLIFVCFPYMVDSFLIRPHLNGMRHRFFATPNPKLQIIHNPIKIKAPIIHGFGRGSKKLGFPTANLLVSNYSDILENIIPGVYAGYALVEEDVDLNKNDYQCSNKSSVNKYYNICFKAAINVGYSPTFVGEENPIKTVEAYLIRPSSPVLQKNQNDKNIHKDLKILNQNNQEYKVQSNYFHRDFYDKTLRLSLVGYLRPELKFDSLSELITHIKQDVIDIDHQLDTPEFLLLRDQDPWF